MSSAIQDELSNLTNSQLRSRLLQHGMGNMPVTDTTRQVLLNKLRRTLQAEKSTQRRETMHVTKYSGDEKIDSKPAPASKKNNRRNTVNAIPMTSEDIVPIAITSNKRRSGRITPTLKENGPSAPISIAPSENDIIELDEEPVREPYVPPRRASRSPSLGKSQTVVTSYKTEVAKPIVIIESNEEDDEEDEEDEISEGNARNNLYPSLPTNGFNISPMKKPTQPTLGRTTTHTSYQPTSYKPSLYEQRYSDLSKFKAPKPSTSSSTSELNRRYTTSSYASENKYEDDSTTEHSDIDAPYLSDFARRLSQLRPEPIHRKIIDDVKQQHTTDDSFWQSFSNLVNAFGRKYGRVIVAGCLLMLVVFIYVFFIMA